MKQKLDTPVTKRELNETLQYYPTKTELKEAEKKLRNELMQAQIESSNKLDQKFIERYVKSQAASRAESDYKFSLIQEDLDRKFSLFTNRILTAIDPLIQDMKIRQQEREIVAAQIADVRDRTDNHEKRITQLEHAT